WISANPSSARGPQATAESRTTAVAGPTRRLMPPPVSPPAAPARDVGEGPRRAGPRPADEVVHAAVDAEELHQRVEHRDRKQPSEPGGVNEPRHHEPAAVTAHGTHDPVRGVLGREDGQQQAEARLHTREHAGADVKGADDRRLHAAAEPAELQPQRLVEADGRMLARAVVDETRRADEPGGGR